MDLEERSHCFKAYDIRGIAGPTIPEGGTLELTEAFAHRLGSAFGTVLDGGAVAVGRDIRRSSPELAEGLIAGLTAAGSDVLDLGEVTTGCVYHAAWTLDVKGAIMVTASHLSMRTHNGFKMCYGTLPLAAEDIQDLRKRMIEGRFRTGEGRRIPTDHMPAYLDAILESVGPLTRSVHLGIDAGNAVPGPFLVELLTRLGAEVEPIHCEWDPDEPHHGADPTRPKNMHDLSNIVVDRGCEFGIGVDGDGDRIGAVDGAGTFLHPDRLIALIGEDILAQVPPDAPEEARTVLYDVKCSMNVERAIVAAGGIPRMARTGHSFMKRALAEAPLAPMAAEMSGHIFMADRGWYGFDCSLYNAARLVEVWSRTPGPSKGGPTLAARLDALAPALPTSGEVKVPCAEARKESIIDGIINAFEDHEASTVDGIRVRFSENGEDTGWYLARRSNTEEVLIMRVEALTDQHLDGIMDVVRTRVGGLIDLSRLEAAVA